MLDSYKDESDIDEFNGSAEGWGDFDEDESEDNVEEVLVDQMDIGDDMIGTPVDINEI